MTTVIELSPGVLPGDVLAGLESTTVKARSLRCSLSSGSMVHSPFLKDSRCRARM